MKLEFTSVVDDIINKEILEYIKEDNKIITDKLIFIIDNGIKCIRKDIKQELNFIINTKTSAILEDEYKIIYNFNIYTEKLVIDDKRIYIKYILYLDNEEISKHKIYINFLDKLSKKE